MMISFHLFKKLLYHLYAYGKPPECLYYSGEMLMAFVLNAYGFKTVLPVFMATI